MKRSQLWILLALLATLWLPRAGLAQHPVFSQAELDQMLAPVALYPDSVLSHVLIAATHPIEVIQAARWSAENAHLSGEVAVESVAYHPWDPSVMALVAFPSLLARMSQDIDWTYRLGDAFLFQEEQVISTIQELRVRAWAQGHLRSNDQVRVVRETHYITIEPVRSRVVFLPVYDTRVVFGTWWWHAHPPVFWHYSVNHRRNVFVHWGVSYHVPPAFYFSAVHWPQRRVVVVHHHHHYHHFHPRAPRRLQAQSSRDVLRHSDTRHWQQTSHHRQAVSHRQGQPQQRIQATPTEQRLTRAATSASASPAREVQRALATQSRQQELRGQERRGSDARAMDMGQSSRLTTRSESARPNVQRSVEPGQAARPTADRLSSRADASSQAINPRASSADRPSQPRAVRSADAQVERAQSTRAPQATISTRSVNAPPIASAPRVSSPQSAPVRQAAPRQADAPRPSSTQRSISPASSQPRQSSARPNHAPATSGRQPASAPVTRPSTTAPRTAPRQESGTRGGRGNS